MTQESLSCWWPKTPPLHPPTNYSVLYLLPRRFAFSPTIVPVPVEHHVGRNACCGLWLRLNLVLMSFSLPTTAQCSAGHCPPSLFIAIIPPIVIHSLPIAIIPPIVIHIHCYCSQVPSGQVPTGQWAWARKARCPQASEPAKASWAAWTSHIAAENKRKKM